MTVWVDAWQMQCCGEPFGVGSRVSWALAERDPGWVTAVLGAGVIVDAAEDHHGGVPDGTPPTAGTVTAVSAVHCRPAPAPGQSGQAPRPAVSPAVFTPVTRVDGRTRDRDGLNFAGYLVHLSTSRHPVPSAWVPITAAVAEGRRGSPVPRHGRDDQQAGSVPPIRCGPPGSRHTQELCAEQDVRCGPTGGFS